ncbi:hypothetical protein SARC_08495 [Sphaeroforma arctica JP610]|uniref:Uncharacterized protein n=1 Tax=Sphaeroforma arctica JP610 TaxID=667725 RepID=A0A0L0FT34_9EUKA|nr:hypothetical protein SARC_08495 [Sphaeroforma arctica JP610]KNC79098.1 hypothetical protein SARC_08495 [Sphaeroforma arctica JP610]|eukprot:XP_014153000.1 hypothetical protein SARC_08495 [Sphaeroforma arctica JP610]
MSDCAKRECHDARWFGPEPTKITTATGCPIGRWSNMGFQSTRGLATGCRIGSRWSAVREEWSSNTKYDAGYKKRNGPKVMPKSRGKSEITLAKSDVVSMVERSTGKAAGTWGRDLGKGCGTQPLITRVRHDHDALMGQWVIQSVPSQD